MSDFERARTYLKALVTLPAPSGRVALSVTASNRNGVSLRLHAGSGASEAELTELFRQALLMLGAQRMGLKP